MREQISEALKKAAVGSRGLKMTLRQNAAPYVVYLRRMLRLGICSMKIDDISKTYRIHDIGEWERDEDRTFSITLTKGFKEIDEKWFIERLDSAIEKIEVIK